MNDKCRHILKMPDGRLAEIDTLLIDADEWENRPESKSPHWSVRRVEGLVLAVLLMT